MENNQGNRPIPVIKEGFVPGQGLKKKITSTRIENIGRWEIDIERKMLEIGYNRAALLLHIHSPSLPSLPPSILSKPVIGFQ